LVSADDIQESGERLLVLRVDLATFENVLQPESVD
jgi:hypothetical protein